MQTLKSWGVAWTPAIRYAPDWDCRCGFPTPFKLEDRMQYLVGFSTGGPPSRNKEAVGVQIFRCPQCFELFYFHITATAVRVYAEIAPQWPKT